MQAHCAPPESIGLISIHCQFPQENCLGFEDTEIFSIQYFTWKLKQNLLTLIVRSGTLRSHTQQVTFKRPTLLGLIPLITYYTQLLIQLLQLLIGFIIYSTGTRIKRSNLHDETWKRKMFTRNFEILLWTNRWKMP